MVDRMRAEAHVGRDHRPAEPTPVDQSS
jgi:hypothetical protein